MNKLNKRHEMGTVGQLSLFKKLGYGMPISNPNLIDNIEDLMLINTFFSIIPHA